MPIHQSANRVLSRAFIPVVSLLALFSTFPREAMAVDRIRGQVVDLATGKPIAGAYVICPDTEDVVKSDEQGVFIVRGAFIHRKRTQPGGLGGLLSGGLIGGPMALFGIGSGSVKLLDASPKRLVVLADGYKPYYGRANVLTGDVGKAMVVVERIGLATADSDQTSVVVTRAIDQTGQADDSVHESGSAEGASLKPLGFVLSAEFSPQIVTDSNRDVLIKVVLDGPPLLLDTFAAWAYLSVGKSVRLQPVKADKTSRTTELVGRVRMPPGSYVCEVKLGGAYVIRAFERSKGFLDVMQAAHIVELLGNIVQAVGNTGADVALSVVSGTLLAQNNYLVSLPSATEAESRQWERCLAAFSGEQTHEGLAAISEGTPAAVTANCMLQYTLIGDDMTRLREWAQSTTLPDAGKDPGATIVARDLALAWCLLYSESQSAADRTAAVETLRRAAKLMSGYGPGLRQLADAAFVIEEFGLAAQLYTTSAKLLGDSDSVLGDPIVHTSYGPRSTLEVVANWFNPADVLRALIGNQPVRRTIRRRTGADLAQACKELDKAKKRNRWQDWYRASTLLEDAQDYSNALIHARRATSVAETAEAWNWKGVLLSKMGSKQHLDEQLEAFEKACALAPSDGVMLSNLARTLWERKRYDDACAVYERVKRARLPRDSEDIKYATMTVLGWKEADNSPEKCEVAALHFVLDDTGHLDSDATVPVASEVARLAAKDGRPWAHWCLYRLTGDRSHLDAAIAANPEEPLFCAERMEDLLADGDLDGALTWAAKAQELRRNRAPLPKGLDRAARKMLDEVYRQRLLDLADGMQNYVKLLKRQRRADADAPSVSLPKTGT